MIGAVVGFDICGRRDGWGVREYGKLADSLLRL